MENHYERLGVHPAAHPDVVHAAYRALAKLHHPDNGSTPDAARMREVNEAWAVLSDPQRRARHDADLRRAWAADTEAGTGAGTGSDTAGGAGTGAGDDCTGDGGPVPGPTMGGTGWGEAGPAPPPPPPSHWAQPPPPWAYPPPPQWASSPSPQWSYPPPPQWTPAPPQPSASPFVPNPTDVAGRRILAAILDGTVVVLVAVFSWLAFVMATYDAVEATDTTPDCAALHGTVRYCEEIDGTLYVSDAASSLVVRWLAWLVPIVAIHVVMQTQTGATVGKHVCGLRTVHEDGRPPSLPRTFVRTALAAVDLFPYCFPAVGFLLVLTNRRHQRVGDLAARTFVVARAAAGQPVTPPAR